MSFLQASEVGGGGDTESRESQKEMSEKKEGLDQEEEAGKKKEKVGDDEEEVSRHEGSSSPVHGFTTPGKVDDNVVRAKMFEDFGIGQVSFIILFCEALY